MPTSARNSLTDSQAARFFQGPEAGLHRQYEALRAYFVEQLPSAEVARRFGYSPGAFRVLCYQFRHDAGKRATFFPPPQQGPRSAPARDRVRELVIALRKKNLSVYDSHRQLSAAGPTLSVTSITRLLQEEGLARLPRRRDEERPATVRAEAADVADVRLLSLAPRSFRTGVGGLFFFVPLMRALNLTAVVQQAGLSGSRMIPAEQALRTLLALKLIGTERKSHVMNLVDDEGIALFAGLNVVPKRSSLAAYSSALDDRTNQRLLAAWFTEIQQAGLTRGRSLDLDFHPVPAQTTQEPLDSRF
jgi:hypothetical protein